MNDEVGGNESDYEILFLKILSKPIFPVTRAAALELTPLTIWLSNIGMVVMIDHFINTLRSRSYSSLEKSEKIL